MDRPFYIQMHFRFVSQTVKGRIMHLLIIRWLVNARFVVRIVPPATQGQGVSYAQ